MKNNLNLKLRINIKRTSKHFYIRLIDDNVLGGNVIIYEISTLSEKIKRNSANLENLGVSFGNNIKDKMQNREVFFDRNNLRYIFNVKLVADAIRKAGIKF